MSGVDVRIGAKLKNLRLRSDISLRGLAQKAGVSVSYLSAVEKDSASPTLATLRRILAALDTNFIKFFSDEEDNTEQYFFRKSGMRTVVDRDREYTFILPQRDDIAIEMMDENYFYGDTVPEFETMENDFSGYVISGKIIVEVGDEPPTHLDSGDAFYVPRGTAMRGYCEKGERARLLTVLYRRKSAVDAEVKPE